MRIATPSPWWTFTSYSLPVLIGAPEFLNCETPSKSDYHGYLARGLRAHTVLLISACGSRSAVTRFERLGLPLIWKARWRTPRLWPHTKARGTTKLYDRTGDEITLDEVERIAI
jgi:hypothetical protein